ncbi:MAG TPA: amidohydrolase family protein [Caulifigura sp.]|nr:amidohydrolase family protein [Caulifigura sp.]
MPSISRRISVAARIVCPLDGPPLDNGVVEIEDGWILEVHQRPHADTLHLGDVAILPGLVNAHTHLEFSNLEAPLGPPNPFAAWIGSVVAERRRRCRIDDDVKCRVAADPIARGLRECFATGTSVVADIVTGALADVDGLEQVQRALRAGRLIPFPELLSPTPSGVSATLDAAREYARTVSDLAADAEVGLSPHAPYTVTRDLLDRAVQWADAEVRLLAMHVAETREELELLKKGTGPLAEMLQRIGQWDPDALGVGGGLTPVLKALSQARLTLLVHGNYLTDKDLQFIEGHPCLSLVYCPRTHEYFGHDPWPLEQALERRILVALGTDSRASNPDMNLWEEAKVVARRFPQLAPETIFGMATIDGAKTLGIGHLFGTLSPGKTGDLCCVQLAGEGTDPLRAALHPDACVIGSLHAGEWVNRPL